MRASARFRRLLGVVLQLGNALNKDTRKGGAQGFKLGSLIKLAQTKTNSRQTVLEYVR